MFLHTKLDERKDPIRVAFIGCGKFVSMFLSQYSHLNKIEIDSIVDLNIDTNIAINFDRNINIIIINTQYLESIFSINI